MTREAEIRKTPGGCCSKSEIFLTLGFPFTFEHLQHLLSLGYRDKASYTAAGLAYVIGKDFVAIGPFGGSELRIKCRNPQCETNLLQFQADLKEIPDELNLKIPAHG